MYMKNYKTLYKIITLSLVFSGCLYNYNMHNVYAGDLNIIDEKGDNYLVDSGGTFKFLDGLIIMIKYHILSTMECLLV